MSGNRLRDHRYAWIYRPQIILAMFIQMVQLISKMHVFCLFYACINHKRLLCMVDKVF